jgi:hypothetical protein
MRIACIHIPQFALQAVTRQDPSLVGKAVALTAAAPGSPVIAYSRPAYGLGVRAGMSAPVARQLSTSLVLIAESRSAERELVASLAESLQAMSPLVDGGTRTGQNMELAPSAFGPTAGALHYALYAEVPAGTRGATFGTRARELASAHGVTVRIGIADDKFTAWAAASHMRATAGRVDDNGSIVSVPRGGAAAFLSPLPLSMLPIAPEVQHMLSTLGVRTLGEFAALPEPTTGSSASGFRSRGFSSGDSSGFGMDLQALARGDSHITARLQQVRDRLHSTETIAVSAEHSAAAAIGTLAERLALVLKGRNEAAAQIRFSVSKVGEESPRKIELLLVPTVTDAAVLADRLGACLGDAAGASSLSVDVIGKALHLDDNDVVATVHNDNEAVSVDSLQRGFQLSAFADSRAIAVTSDGLDRHGYRPVRRGKQRRRSEVTAQSRLFGG